jgi:hypothetical protein
MACERAWLEDVESVGSRKRNLPEAMWKPGIGVRGMGLVDE